ncbi:hypothetical protein N7488_009598 [Penicillium malachiteum]|nr:hypothetical protein N7488_009598 [Penicillium malachiteum]
MRHASSFNTMKISVFSRVGQGLVTIRPMHHSEMFGGYRRQEAFKEDPRSPGCISGLKIEYFDNSTPSVLGQWMEEVDDGFEFSPGEAIQSLNIWLTPVGRSSGCRGPKVGQVTVILIETSDSRNMKFCLSRDEPLPREMLVDQYQSDPGCGEDLNAISWVLNSRCDRIRAVASTNTERRPEILVPEQSHPPYDQTETLLHAGQQ